LDRQPGVKTASTFQVWGRRGYGDTHPLNMGMMYLDNETSKRWMLKFSDAKALSQVDAVFVTIEPHGGSNEPKGRQLLYASLRTPPNHP
jgi:anti-sigma-K factor RskA